MRSSSCRRLASHIITSTTANTPKHLGPPALSGSGSAGLHGLGHYDHASILVGGVGSSGIRHPQAQQQTRGKKTKTTISLADLPQGPIRPPPSEKALSTTTTLQDGEQQQQQQPQEEDEGPTYPTVVLQARRNMAKFENCVLLTRVGGFYELYFEHAEEYGPLLNLKVASKKTSAGPVPMAGFPFFQLERFLKILVQELNCYVAIAEEFPNDAGDKVKSNGLLHDRKVARIVTPGTLIDENFIDPYANNYVMAIHLDHSAEDVVPSELTSEKLPDTETSNPSIASVGLAWLDISTGQFYTQSTTIAGLSSILSRVGPREMVIDKALQSQEDHLLFTILAEDKHLITYSPHTTPMPTRDWTPMLESEVPASTLDTFTAEEVCAGSLLLQYVRDRLLGLSMKLQPPVRHESLQVLTIDKNSMRSLEIKQTIRDGAFRGSLLHAIRRTVTKSGARLLNDWLSAPSTDLDTITRRQDLVDHFIRYPDLRDEIIQLLRRSHDSQRLVQKFAFGRGDPDDLVGLASTIRATEEIVKLLSSSSSDHNPFGDLVSRISLDEPSKLADRIRSSIDEDGLSAQHQLEDSTTGQLLLLASDIVSSEGTSEEAATILPKSTASKIKKSGNGGGGGRPSSIRDHYDADNPTFTMKPGASPALTALHAELNALLQQRVELTETLSTRYAAPSLTLRWAPNLGHIVHTKGKDVKQIPSTLPSLTSSRSTRTFALPEWTSLGQSLHQTRFAISTEETRLFASLREHVVRNLVKLRRNAAVLDELDVTTSFARLAVENGLVRPVLSASHTSHKIMAGRHPTVELGLRVAGRSFAPNDCLVGTPAQGRLWLITGPNMAGKSTYLRQNALITILAQTGCFVPAAHAEIGIVDAIFSRVGSADNLYNDQSTFMVEMLETAQILRSATARSFVIMDEIGRGTTPDDGTAVAFAALWHLVMVNKCRALFATHFHGLADLARQRKMLADQGGEVECYCTDVAEDGRGGFVYVHRLRKGINRQSHALKVAKLAGLPEAAITVAKEVLTHDTAKTDHDGGTEKEAGLIKETTTAAE